MIDYHRRLSIPTFISTLWMLLFFIAGCKQRKSNSHSGYKTVNGTKLYYETMGSGTPLVVVHGKPLLNMSYLTKPLKPLSNHHKLIFYDQRLSGKSSADVKPSQVTVQNYVEDIEGLRKTLHLGKIDLMGHSWGGFLAMKYALKYPQHLMKLILADPIPARSEVWQQEQVALRQRSVISYRQKQQKILSSKKYEHNKIGRTKALMRLRLSKQFHDSTYADSLKLYLPSDFAQRSRRFGYVMPELQHYNVYPKLKKLQAPTLIIYGADEPVAKVSGKKLNQTIPNSKLVIIKKAGHFPFIEQQGHFLKVVNQFLAQKKDSATTR